MTETNVQPVEPQPSGAKDHDDAYGDPKEEYKAAVAMIQDTGHNIWVINGSYLVVSGLLLKPLLDTPISLGPVRLATLGLIGLLFAILWLASFERNYAFYNLRIRQARALELRLGFTLFTDGHTLSEKGIVAPRGAEPLAMSGPGKIGSIQKLTRTLILLFGAAFAVAAVVAFAQLYAA